ncbi:hypothetical protein PoMZ_05899, partial [Pyricularia oryzae]
VYYLGQKGLKAADRTGVNLHTKRGGDTRFILAPKAIPTQLQMGNSPSPTKPQAMVAVRYFWLNSNC